MYTRQYHNPLHEGSYRPVASVPTLSYEVAKCPDTYCVVAEHTEVDHGYPPRRPIAHSGSSLENRVDRPDWVHDSTTYLIWRKSLRHPDKLFILPSSKCLHCGCQRFRWRADIGIEECAWCGGEGRLIRDR